MTFILEELFKRMHCPREWGKCEMQYVSNGAEEWIEIWIPPGKKFVLTAKEVTQWP